MIARKEHENPAAVRSPLSRSTSILCAPSLEGVLRKLNQTTDLISSSTPHVSRMTPSPLKVAVALAGLGLASAASRMLVNQSEQYAIYSSVGTTVVGGKPYFAFADGLNPPAFADLFDGATGALVWSFTNASGTTGTPTFLVDTARHCEAGPSPGADAVDVFVAVFDGAGANVYGLSSAAPTAAPAWAVSLPGCGENIEGGTYIMMEASDSGNRVAIQCHHAGVPATARVYSIAGQTGKVEWNYDLGAGVQAGQGNVQVSTDGAFVLFVNEQGKPTPNSATAFVLDGATGQLRDSVAIPFFICAAISDDGAFLAVGDDPAVHVFAWDAGSAKYKAAYDVSPPPGLGAVPWDVQTSAGPDADEMLVVGYISGDVKSVQVAAWSLASQALVVNWNSKTNKQLQENPTIRADGDYIGVSLWGDTGEAGYPTVVLLKRGSDAAIFDYVTPGSMSAVDVNVVTTGGQDTIYLAAGGKAVPANQFGNGVRRAPCARDARACPRRARARVRA